MCDPPLYAIIDRQGNNIKINIHDRNFKTIHLITKTATKEKWEFNFMLKLESLIMNHTVIVSKSIGAQSLVMKEKRRNKITNIHTKPTERKKANLTTKQY